MKDAVAYFADLSAAIRSLTLESREARAEVDERLTGLACAVADLAADVRAFGRSEERLRGQIALVSAVVDEHERDRDRDRGTGGARRT